MRNLKLKNFLAMCLLLLVELCHAQEVESIIRYDLNTTTSYSIDECSYETVGAINPLYWIDKQKESVKTRVTEIHYDDCSVKTEIQYLNSDNYFPSWMRKRPHKLVIDMNNSTTYDRSGKVISSLPRSAQSIDIQRSFCDTYFQQYLDAPSFSPAWAEELIKLGYIRVDLDRFTYKLISQDQIFIINDKDYTVTILSFERGYVKNKRVIKRNRTPFVKYGSNNGGIDEDLATVMDDEILTTTASNPDGTIFTMVIRKDYSNYQITYNGEVESRSREASLPKEVFISPNPASESVTISQDINQATQLRIVNVQGVTVYTNDSFLGEDQINTSSFIPGIYFVQLSNRNEIITDKLIIK